MAVTEMGDALELLPTMNFARSRLGLLLLGLASELIYLLYFVRQFPLLRYEQGPYRDMGQITGYSHGQFWLFLGAFAALFLLLAGAWRLTLPRVSREEHGGRREGTHQGMPLQPSVSPESTSLESGLVPGARSALWIVLGFGALFGLTMTFVYPVTANDVFSYVDQSLIMVQYHQNPIAVPPAVFLRDPLMSLSGGWAYFGAPYGPLGLVFDALPAVLVHRSLLANLILLKLMFSAMTLLCAYAVHELLRRISPRQALSGCLLVAWNPLILFEISANGHNDVAMVLFAAFALLAVADGQWTLGPALLMGSALVKYASLPLLPLVLVYAASRVGGWRDRVAYLLRTGGVVLTIAALAYLPFWIGVDTFRRALQENQYYLYSFSSVLHNLLLNGVTLDAASAAGRLLFVLVYGFALWLSTRSLQGLMAACLLTIFAFLSLAINDVKYWYLVWPAILAVALPSTSARLAAFLMACGAELAAALNIYAWHWLGVTVDNFRPLDNVSYLAIFALPAVVMVTRFAATPRR